MPTAFFADFLAGKPGSDFISAVTRTTHAVLKKLHDALPALHLVSTAERGALVRNTGMCPENARQEQDPQTRAGKE